MKSLIAFLFGVALAVFLLGFLGRLMTFVLSPDYIPSYVDRNKEICSLGYELEV